MNNLIELKQIEGMAFISVEKKTHPHFNFRDDRCHFEMHSKTLI
jgi:hypothetical protein